MNTKSLNTIQVLAKIARIMCRIIYIACIVGIIGCALSLLIVLISGTGVIRVGDISLYTVFARNADVSLGTLYTAIAVGIVLCTGEMYIAKIAGRYFDHELAAGTPFTHEGAKELLRVGIHAAWIPMAAISLASIAYLLIDTRFENVIDMHLDNFLSSGFGFALIILALICRHGADIAEANKNAAGVKHAEG